MLCHLQVAQISSKQCDEPLGSSFRVGHHVGQPRPRSTLPHNIAGDSIQLPSGNSSRMICRAFPHAARQTSTGPKSLRKVAPLQFQIRISPNQQVDMLIRAWFHQLSPNSASAKFNCHTQRDHVHRIDVTQRSSVSLMAEEQTNICMWTGIPRCSQMGFKNNASRPTCAEAFISSPALGRATLFLM